MSIPIFEAVRSKLSFSGFCVPSGKLSPGERMKWLGAFRPLENTSWGSAPWFPLFQSWRVWVSQVLPGNGCGLWDSTRGLWRVEILSPLWLFTLLLSSCVKCLQTQRERHWPDLESRRESSQSGCNSRSWSPVPISSCRDRDETLIWISFQ